MYFSRTFARSLTVSSLLAALAGCSGSTAAPDDGCAGASDPGCGVASAQQRLESPGAPAIDVATVVHGNTAFAFDLYRQIAGSPGNLCFSPFSVSKSLAMASAGARGYTALEMAAALHLDLPQSRLHPAFNTLDHALTHPTNPGAGADGGVFHLGIASAIWDQQGYPFAAPFLDTLARDYGAEARSVDFSGAPDQALSTINGWMGEQTGERIDSLLDPGSITGATRLVLGNAVFFSAAWQTPFDPDDTRFATFTRRDGTTREVPTMTATQDLAYGEGSGYTALQIPYDAGDLAMILVLPSPGGMLSLESTLTPARLTSIVDGLDRRSVSVSLPVFKIESSLALGSPLAALGMPTAFTDLADFTGMSPRHGLALDSVVHRTFIDVDEAGTEAAAATATGFRTTAAYLPAAISFDRPYLFLIRDGRTGTILFLGRVDDPST
jgi:serpin B